MSHQIHTYTELQQQIHDDLRIQHPEWIAPSGESLAPWFYRRVRELSLFRSGLKEQVTRLTVVCDRRETACESSA